MKVRTLFISDVHLGTIKCQADKLLEVLKRKKYPFDVYALNSDNELQKFDLGL